MKKHPYSPETAMWVGNMTKKILECPIQLMSVDEQEGSLKLSEPEFLARANKLINDPESGLPADEYSRKILVELLAKLYAKGIEPTVVKKYAFMMAAAPKKATTASAPVKPLKNAAKKRKIAALRQQLDKKPK